MLLTIGEPSSGSQSPQIAVGLDLGTTNTVVAVSKAADNSADSDLLSTSKSIEVEVLKHAYSGGEDPRLPSVIALDSTGEYLYGFDALAQTERLSSLKRVLGRDSNEWPAHLKQRISRSIIQSQDTPLLQLGECELTPEEWIAKLVVQALKSAESIAPKTQWAALVITVPAYFDEVQRVATQRALTLAGYRADRIISEPTAAALAFDFDTGANTANVSADTRVIVFDLGGGTFDCSLLQADGDNYEILASAGDTHLGGDDYDAALLELFHSKSHATDLSEARLKNDLELSDAEILTQLRKVRERLSDTSEVTFSIGNRECTFNSEDLEKIIAPSMQKIQALCQRALRDIGMEITDFSRVLLVGGTTRMPSVRQAVEKMFSPLPVENCVDLDTSVAVGAASYAASIGGLRSEKIHLVDVIPLSLGLEVLGGLVETIIPRNTTIPTSAMREFTTGRDNQSGIKINLYQGEREQVAHNRHLGSFTLSELPPMKAGMPKIAVKFEVDEDGLLLVSAREETTNLTAEIKVQPHSSLSEDAIRETLEDAAQNAPQDALSRAFIENKVAAEQLIDTVNAALEEDEGILSEIDKNEISASVSALKRACQGQSHKEIQVKLEALTERTQNFAQARIDRSINKVLLGKDIKDVSV